MRMAAPACAAGDIVIRLGRICEPSEAAASAVSGVAAGERALLFVHRRIGARDQCFQVVIAQHVHRHRADADVQPVRPQLRGIELDQVLAQPHEMRRPEHWGLQRGDALVRTVENAIAEKITAHVLVAGESAERSALYLAANGCDVTAIDSGEEMLERVMAAAVQAGLAERVHAFAAELPQFQPDHMLRAVVCSHSALENLTERDRARVIEALQSATTDGGVHLVETIAAGSAAIEQLRSTYQGWAITVEPRGAEQVFLATKSRRAD